MKRLSICFLLVLFCSSVYCANTIKQEDFISSATVSADKLSFKKTKMWCQTNKNCEVQFEDEELQIIKGRMLVVSVYWDFKIKVEDDKVSLQFSNPMIISGSLSHPASLNKVTQNNLLKVIENWKKTMSEEL